MKKLIYLGHPGIVAILAFFMQLFTIKSPEFGSSGIKVFYSWIGFAAWGSYFLAGCTFKGGLKVVGCWAGGIVSSICIIYTGTILQGVIHPVAAWSIAVGFIAFFMILFENVSVVDMIPAWFIGAGCFFGLNTMISTLSAASALPADDGSNMYRVVGAVVISCIVGQIFGYMTIYLRSGYGNILEKDNAVDEGNIGVKAA